VGQHLKSTGETESNVVISYISNILTHKGNRMLQYRLVLLRFQNVSCRSVSVGFAEKNLGFRFGLGFHDKRIVNFFMARVIWHDFQFFHHH